MIREFRVQKVDNGYMLNVTRREIVGDGFDNFVQQRFVFETPAKLAKAIKLVLADLKQDEQLPF